MRVGRNKKALGCGSSPSASAVKEATGHGLRSGTEGVTYLPCLTMLGDYPGLQILKKKMDLRGEDFLLEVKTLSGLT